MPEDGKTTGPNWYKVATILLSAIMVAIMFVSRIYYKRLDDERSNLNKIDDKIEELLNRREELILVPKVRVELQTLEQCGLPDSAFEGLPDVPAVLRIRQIGGQTAKGITVEVTSAFEILSFSPDPSVEEFSYHIDDKDSRLLVSVPQLRRGSVIQGTIRCARVGRLSQRTRVDTGVVTDEESEEQQVDTRLGLDSSDPDEIHPQSYSSAHKIDAIVANLRLLAKVERNRSTIEIAPSFAKSLGAGFVPIGIGMAFIMIPQFVKGRKGRELGNRIGSLSRKGDIRIGMERDSLVALLGPPHRTRIVREGGDAVEVLEYRPQSSIFHGWQPDLSATVKDGRIVEYEVKEYGERQYI